jgi:hypothetical protein
VDKPSGHGGNISSFHQVSRDDKIPVGFINNLPADPFNVPSRTVQPLVGSDHTIPSSFDMHSGFHPHDEKAQWTCRLTALLIRNDLASG